MVMDVVTVQVNILSDVIGVYDEIASVTVRPASATEPLRIQFNPRFFRASTNLNAFYRVARSVTGQADYLIVDSLPGFVSLPVLWDTPGTTSAVTYKLLVRGRGYTSTSPGTSSSVTTIAVGRGTGSTASEAESSADSRARAQWPPSAGRSCTHINTATEFIGGSWHSTISYSCVVVSGTPGTTTYNSSTGRVGILVGAYILAVRGDLLQVPPFWVD